MTKTLIRSKSFEYIFLAWLITLPFGPKIGGISLGFFTFYPNLMFSAILLIPVFFTFKNWPKIYKIVSLFLLAWLMYGLIYGLNIGFEKDVMFDIRSLVMQLVFALILFAVRSLFGNDKFTSLLVVGLRCFLVILVLFGLFEFYTGIHLSGTTSAKFGHLAVGLVFYAPTFIYDNPNDYMLYGMFVLLALTLVDKELRKRPFAIIAVALIFTLYNLCSNSRLAFFGLTLIILIQIAIVFWQNRSSFTLKRIIPPVLGMILIAILFMVNPLFYGPKYNTVENPYQYNDLRIVHLEGDSITDIRAFQYLSDDEKKQIKSFKETSSVQYIRGEDVVKIVSNEETFPEEERVKIEEGIPADQIRINLIRNGFSLIRQNPLLGVGPGQFRKMHTDNTVENPTGTIIAPHNFIIELLSQYGIFGWAYFGFILYLFIYLLKKWRQIGWRLNVSALVFFITLPLLWLMPSSYLYLDINWILLPFLTIALLNFQTQPDGK